MPEPLEDGIQQPGPEDLDVVQHPSLGTLKFPKSMSVDDRNALIDQMMASQPPAPTIRFPGASAASRLQQMRQIGMNIPENAVADVPPAPLPPDRGFVEDNYRKLIQVGHEQGRALGEAIFNPMSKGEQQQAEQQSPRFASAMKRSGAVGAGLGGVAGEMAVDPLTYLAGATSRLGRLGKIAMTGYFAEEGVRGTIDSAETVHKLWTDDKVPVEDKIEATTSTIVYAAMTAFMLKHGISETRAALQDHFNRIPDPQVRAAVMQKVAQELPKQLPGVDIKGLLPAPTIGGEMIRTHLGPSEGPPIQLPESTLGRREGPPIQLPEHNPPHETQQPSSNLSGVDRQPLPGELVDPRTLKVDWESHPFRIEDDEKGAEKRIKEGNIPTALVHTDENTGQREVVDGHGSIMAALKTGTPIKVTEVGDMEGAEAIGARTESHYQAGGDKDEVNASTGMVTKGEPTVPELERQHAELVEHYPVPEMEQPLPATLGAAPPEAKPAAAPEVAPKIAAAREENARTLTAQGNKRVSAGAEQYIGERETSPKRFVEVDPRAKLIADAYDRMQHSPNDGATKKSYDALKKEIKAQWEYATKRLGIHFEGIKDDPYKNSKEMMADVRDNNRLKFFLPADMPTDHPLAEVDPETGLTYSQMFRAVHDLFGHAAEGFEFGPKGEENAWNAHRRMFSKEAIPALTTETKGQNSWVNYGAHLRDAAGHIPSRDEPGYKAPADRPFAPQKAGLLPSEFYSRPDDKWTDQAVLDHIRSGKDYAILQAENPGNNRISDEENAKRNAALVRDVKARGYDAISVGGNTKDVEDVTEHAYFVPDIKPKEAATLGRKYGQAAILDTRGLHDLQKNTLAPADTKNLIFGDDARAQQYFTTIGNTDFHVPLDFSKEASTTEIVRFDTRSGAEHLLTPEQAATYKPKPFEIVSQRFPDSSERILARGVEATEAKLRQPISRPGERGSATPGFLNFLSTSGLSEVGRSIIEKIKGTKSVEGWPEVARFLPKEDREKAGRVLQERVTQAMNELGDPRLIEEAVKAGSISRGWYKRTGDLLKFMFGGDSDKFVNILAATSPMKTVEQNFMDAFNFYAKWVEAGRPTGRDNYDKIRAILPEPGEMGVATGAIRTQLYNILANGADASGPKVGNFAANLKGNMEPITKDRLMAYLFGQRETAWGSKSKRLAADAMIRSISKKLNMLPAEVQESGWSFIRTVLNYSPQLGAAEDTGWRGGKSEVQPGEAARKITESDIRASASEFTQIIAKNERVRAALDELARRTGNEGLSVKSIESSERFQSALAESQRTRGIAGGLGGASRDVLARAAERAARARSGGEITEEGDTTFNPSEMQASKTLLQAGVKIPSETRQVIEGLKARQAEVEAQRRAEVETLRKARETTYNSWLKDPSNPRKKRASNKAFRALGDKLLELYDNNNRSWQELQTIEQQLANMPKDRNVGSVRQLPSGKMVVYLPDEPMRLWQEIWKPGSGNKETLHGMNVGRLDAAEMAGHLPEDNPVSKKLQMLINYAAVNAEPNGVVTIVGNRGKGLKGMVSTLREELFHAWQTEAGSGNIDKMFDYEALDRLHAQIPPAVFDHLKKNGYQPEKYTYGAVHEAAAKLAAGDVKINLKEASKFFESYFTEFMVHHGWREAYAAGAGLGVDPLEHLKKLQNTMNFVDRIKREFIDRMEGVGYGADRAVQNLEGQGQTRSRGGAEPAGVQASTTAVPGVAPEAERGTTTEKLIDRYGTTDDPLKAGFIAPDGRMVPLTGEHPRMITSVAPERQVSEKSEEGIKSNLIQDEGVVRARSRMTRAGQELVYSIPDKVTDEQLRQMRAGVGAMGKYGNLVIEQGRPDGKSVKKEFALTRHVDEAVKQLGAHPEGEGEGVKLSAKLNPLSLLGDAARKYLAKPFLEAAGMGSKYQSVKDAGDSQLAYMLRLRDNIVVAARLTAQEHVKKIVGDLDHDQERLAALMSDAQARENLRTNHPAEYRQAQNDPEVMAAVQRYKTYDQAMTAKRQQMGFGVIPDDYLRRVYDEHLSEVVAQPYENAVQLRDLNKHAREADPEYHYANGVHEFGPAYGTKFISQEMVNLDRNIIKHMESQGTIISKGDPKPNSITYAGKTYYSPEQAKLLGEKKTYGVFDPTKYIKWKTGDNLILAPKDIVNQLSVAGRGAPYTAGKFKQFYQKGVIALGAGIPHAFANVPRRIASSYAAGWLNPAAWKANFDVMFSGELRRRTEDWESDPTMKNLVRGGGARVDEDYSGPGSKMMLLQKGHELIFKPGSLGGMGGVDPRARLQYADRLVKQGLGWDEINEKVENKFGKYTRANWTEGQKKLASVTMFPGWIFSSIRTGLEHPIRSTVPAAVLIYAMNKALNKSGMNRDEDSDDFTRIHVGDRAYSPTVFSEPFSKALTLPASEAAKVLMSNGTPREAADQAITGAMKIPGALSMHLIPAIPLAAELGTNRQFLGSEKEIWRQGAFDRKGRSGLLSEGTEAILAHIAQRGLPQVGRLFPETEKAGLDLPGFLGSQVGLPSTAQTAEDRFSRNLGITGRASQFITDLKKTDPGRLQKVVKEEPDTLLEYRYHSAFTRLSAADHRLQQERELIRNSEEVQDKAQYYKQLDQAHQYLMNAAEELDKRFQKQLRETRQKARGSVLPDQLQ